MTTIQDINPLENGDTSLVKIEANFSNLNNDKEEKSVVTTHTSNTNNPHSVTKSQVGLSNVPNLDTTDTISKKHTHSNKDILDGITATFTTEEKIKLFGIKENAEENVTENIIAGTNITISKTGKDVTINSTGGSGGGGDITGPASSIDGAITLFDGTTGKIIKDSAKTIVTTLGSDNTTVPTSKAVADQIASAGGGDMLKATYDTNNSGIVDNAEKVNGLEVKTAVPTGALFTDTTYSVGDGGLTEKNFTQVKSDKLDLIEDNATADQTSIVGISGTKAEFNTALTDDDFAFLGQPNTFTEDQTISNATPTLYFDETDELTYRIRVNADKFEFIRSATILGAWNGTGLGIGITTPSEKLDVNGNTFIKNGNIYGQNNGGNKYTFAKLAQANTSTGYQDFHFLPDYIKSGDKSGGVRTIYGFNSEIDSYQWYSNISGTNLLSIHISGETGNVGIGTTIPTAKTHIKSILDANGTPALRVESSNPQSATAYFVNTGATSGSYDAVIRAIQDSGSSAPAVKIENNGTGNGLYIDQNGNGKGLFIDSEATTEATLLLYNNQNDGQFMARIMRSGVASTAFGVSRQDAVNQDCTINIGDYQLWVDSTGDLRIKSGAPSSDTDGTVVGTQS